MMNCSGGQLIHEFRSVTLVSSDDIDSLDRTEAVDLAAFRLNPLLQCWTEAFIKAFSHDLEA